MKFDCIISNPPYNKSLHLKFLEKYIESANKVISIQPLRWLQDPFAEYKRSTLKTYEKSVAEHINNIEILNAKNAAQSFDIAIYSNLGIYYIDSQNDKKIDYKNFWKKTCSKEQVSIINKVCLGNKCSYLGDVVEQNKRDGIRVPITFIAGNRGTLPIYKELSVVNNGYVNGKDWTKCKNMGGYEKAENSPLPNSIKFNTENEALNFYNSYKLLFSKYLCNITVQQQNIQADYLPFMNDYTHEWTDEMLYKFFDLNDEEIKEIEKYNKVVLK